ncbi:MAG: hypothetical protein M1166_02430 [Candidatus Thermoplasmatota archaeon]|nr:hypothetical protein [Candidatus Thermoplasmatota archaeon]
MINDASLLVGASILIHSTLILTLLVFIRNEKNERNSLLTFPLIAEIVLFPIILLGTIYYYPPSTLLSLGTILVYCVIAGFVFALEIPGFILISRHDQRVVNGLTKLRSNLSNLTYAFSKTYPEFVSAITSNDSYLKESELIDIVNDFKENCDKLRNLNEKFWELLMSEITRVVEIYSTRSKHPYPKLIEVLSLTGLSFLIAQFLHVLG